MHQESPENLLLWQVANRDREALAEVYARFQGPLFRYLFHLVEHKELAEDLLQEVMVIIWQKAHTFRGTTQAAGRIFGIAHHQAFKVLRRDGSIACLELEAAMELVDEQATHEADLLRQATHEEVSLALTSLPPRTS